MLDKMIRRRALSAAALVLVACGGRSAQPQTPAGTGSGYAPVIDPEGFSATIDNPYMPWLPGSRWIYEARTADGLERIVVEVTDQTRVVMGVTTVVVRDEVSVDGELKELTFDWYAQASDGSVWYFGEETAEYEGGQVATTAGSWEAGVDGAQPGVVMPAEPVIGEPYRQEYYEGEAEDMAKVITLDEMITVPAGSFTDVLVTEDWTPLDTKVLESKYYAPGIGVVMEESLKGAKDTVELISFEPPGPS